MQKLKDMIGKRILTEDRDHSVDIEGLSGVVDSIQQYHKKVQDAYDNMNESYGTRNELSPKAKKEYLRIMHLALREMEYSAKVLGKEIQQVQRDIRNTNKELSQGIKR